MRELEFLPSWYGLMRRRKRIVKIQSWMLVVLIGCFAGWVGLTRRSVSAAEGTVAGLQQELDQVHGDQRDLAEQISLQQELQARDQMIASLGFPVQMTRLFQMLDSVMPKEMSLLEITCDTSEQARANTSVAGLAPGVKEEKLVDRRLDVRMKAVTPDDVDLASFLAGLAGKYSFVEQLSVLSTKPRRDSGHMMREFEVTFSLNLNQR